VKSSAPTVSRADFLSWSYIALDLHKEKGTCTLPFARTPRGMKEVLCSAQTQGVLSVFNAGKDYVKMLAPVTRGEALQVLTGLLDEQKAADVSAFTDLKTESEKQAAKNAIALKWIVPVNATTFGFKKQLTGAETLALLQAVSGAYPDRVRTKITINVAPQGDTGNLPDEELMNAVWQILVRDYLRNNKIDQKEAAYKAIEGMVDSLHDPYTNFFRPAVASDFQSRLKESFLASALRSKI
jgi:hypothetical protein